MNGSGFGTEPYLQIDPETKEISGGVSLDVFDAIADYYSFSYHIKSSFNWYYFHSNGSIGGSLGDVISILPLKKF